MTNNMDSSLVANQNQIDDENNNDDKNNNSTPNGLCKSSPGHYKRRRRLRAKLIIIALTLIVFIRFDWRSGGGISRQHDDGASWLAGDSNMQQRPSDCRTQNTEWALDEEQIYAGQQRRPLVIFASGAYLDSVGQLTSVMNEFVDSLLERVSFMAEIIIESALDEECYSPFEPKEDEDASLDPRRAMASKLAACRRYEAKHNLTTTKLGRNGKPVTESNKQQEQPLDGVVFDRDEFKNVDLFLNQYHQNLGGLLPSGRGKPGGCKLFTLDLNSDDLPANDMGLCCQQFHDCYSKCANKKLDCDLDFRRCLNEICRANFNYRNETLVREFASQPSGEWPPRRNYDEASLAAGPNPGSSRRSHRMSKRNILSSWFERGGNGDDPNGHLHHDMGYEPMAMFGSGAHLHHHHHLDEFAAIEEAEEAGADGDLEEEELATFDEVTNESSLASDGASMEERRRRRQAPPLETEAEEENDEAESEPAGEAAASTATGGARRASSSATGSGGRGGKGDSLEQDPRAIKRLQDKYKACKLASKLLIIGNLAFGCQNYKRSQWQACCSVGSKRR